LVILSLVLFFLFIFFLIFYIIYFFKKRSSEIEELENTFPTNAISFKKLKQKIAKKVKEEGKKVRFSALVTKASNIKSFKNN